MKAKLFSIGSPSQAEKDDYLFDCFHDSGFLDEIVNKDYSIIAGRKGSGKTAIARYLEKNMKSMTYYSLSVFQ